MGICKVAEGRGEFDCSVYYVSTPGHMAPKEWVETKIEIKWEWRLDVHLGGRGLAHTLSARSHTNVTVSLEFLRFSFLFCPENENYHQQEPFFLFFFFSVSLIISSSLSSCLLQHWMNRPSTTVSRGFRKSYLDTQETPRGCQRYHVIQVLRSMWHLWVWSVLVSCSGHVRHRSSLAVCCPDSLSYLSKRHTSPYDTCLLKKKHVTDSPHCSTDDVVMWRHPQPTTPPLTPHSWKRVSPVFS